MANELAVKVKVELDTDYKKLDAQLKSVKEHYAKTPLKLAFGLNQNETKANINKALKSLVDGKQISVPKVTLDVKIDKDNVTAQLRKAIKDAQTGATVKGTDTSASAGMDASQYRSLLSITKEIYALKAKIASTSFFSPENVNQIEQFESELDALNIKQNSLLGGEMSDQQTAGYTGLLTQLKEKNKEVSASIQDAQAKAATAYDRTKKSIEALANSASLLKDKANTQNSLGAPIEKFNAEYQKLQDILDSSDGFASEEERLRALQDQVKNCNTELSRMAKTVTDTNRNIGKDTAFSTMTAQLERFVNANKKVMQNDTIAERVEKLRAALRSGVGDQKLYRKELEDIMATCEQLGLTTETLGQKISRLFKEHFQTALVMAGIHMIQQGAKQVYDNVVAIDTAMVELKKVTNETDAAYSEFLGRASTQAQELGASVDDYIQTTADWARLGYNIADSEELARVATLFKNVGDGIESASDASTYLISTLKGFGLVASDAEHVLDVINQVANTEPVSAQGIGEILTRSSAAMSAANNTFEETVALGTAMNSVLQDEEKTGTALKTVSMYLRATSTELEDSGESAEGCAETVSKLREQLLELSNGKVDIQLDED